MLPGLTQDQRKGQTSIQVPSQQKPLYGRYCHFHYPTKLADPPSQMISFISMITASILCPDRDGALRFPCWLISLPHDPRRSNTPHFIIDIAIHLHTTVPECADQPSPIPLLPLHIGQLPCQDIRMVRHPKNTQDLSIQPRGNPRRFALPLHIQIQTALLHPSEHARATHPTTKRLESDFSYLAVVQ